MRCFSLCNYVLSSKEVKFWLAFSEYPIGIWGGLNLYLYALNNPSNFKDPFGLTIQATEGYPKPGDPCIVCNEAELFKCIFRLSPGKMKCIPCLIGVFKFFRGEPASVVINYQACGECISTILFSVLDCLKDFDFHCEAGKLDANLDCVPCK